MVGLAARPKVALIAGPTASGKSALALALAERFDGTIINADSAQVYRDLRIVTARPSPEEEARAPHRLFGHEIILENAHPLAEHAGEQPRGSKKARVPEADLSCSVAEFGEK